MLEELDYFINSKQYSKVFKKKKKCDIKKIFDYLKRIKGEVFEIRISNSNKNFNLDAFKKMFDDMKF